MPSLAATILSTPHSGIRRMVELARAVDIVRISLAVADEVVAEGSRRLGRFIERHRQ